MRYDTSIYFQYTSPGPYDPTTGDYGEEVFAEVPKRASVTDSGAETMRLIYGEIKQGSLTIRLQNHYTGAFDRIRVGSKIYAVDMSRKLRTGHVFVVHEVQ